MGAGAKSWDLGSDGWSLRAGTKKAKKSQVFAHEQKAQKEKRIPYHEKFLQEAWMLQLSAFKNDGIVQLIKLLDATTVNMLVTLFSNVLVDDLKR